MKRFAFVAAALLLVAGTKLHAQGTTKDSTKKAATAKTAAKTAEKSAAGAQQAAKSAEKSAATAKTEAKTAEKRAREDIKDANS